MFSALTVEESIEDIVPFPSESSNLLSDSSESSSETHLTLTRSTEDQTCKYGSCSREQRRQCMGRLRAYQSSVANVAIGDDGVRVNQPRRCPKDEYQTNRFLVLLVLLLLSMFIVSFFYGGSLRSYEILLLPLMCMKDMGYSRMFYIKIGSH